MKKLGFILGATCAAVIAVGGLTASRLAKQPEQHHGICHNKRQTHKMLQ